MEVDMDPAFAYVMALLACMAFIVAATIRLRRIYDCGVQLAYRVDWDQGARDERSKLWSSEKKWGIARGIAWTALAILLLAPIIAVKLGWP